MTPHEEARRNSPICQPVLQKNKASTASLSDSRDCKQPINTYKEYSDSLKGENPRD